MLLRISIKCHPERIRSVLMGSIWKIDRLDRTCCHLCTEAETWQTGQVIQRLRLSKRDHVSPKVISTCQSNSDEEADDFLSTSPPWKYCRSHQFHSYADSNHFTLCYSCVNHWMQHIKLFRVLLIKCLNNNVFSSPSNSWICHHRHRCMIGKKNKKNSNNADIYLEFVCVCVSLVSLQVCKYDGEKVV